MRNLNPKEVWGYFDDILKIPRLSKKEEKIISYLEQFAGKHQLEFKKDEIGNCLIRKSASAGFEDRETVVLQSHVDMVGEKLAEVDHDFKTDPIGAIIKDGWVTANGTTLGADDGIGIAASLAILESDTIKHGPIECLFTVDEETGMTGAFEVAEDFMKGKILLNLDSEDEGEIFIGCAGGIDTVASLRKVYTDAPENTKGCTIRIDGLQGGHSGDEIHKGYANALKLMTRLLWNLQDMFNIHVASFNGGKLRNAIPRDASAVIVFDEFIEPDVLKTIDEFKNVFRKEVKAMDPNFVLETLPADVPGKVFEMNFSKNLINVLYACPHGVISWSRNIEGLVETSTNLAVIRDNEEYIEITTSQRSSLESAKKDIADRMEALFSMVEAEVIHSDGYPGWNPDPDSEILRISEKLYKELFNKEAEIKAIHAGLECGLFLTKYPDLDMVSFGPTIKGAHTPDERIDIDTVQKFWDFLLALLQRIPKRRS